MNIEQQSDIYNNYTWHNNLQRINNSTYSSSLNNKIDIEDNYKNKSGVSFVNNCRYSTEKGSISSEESSSYSSIMNFNNCSNNHLSSLDENQNINNYKFYNDNLQHKQKKSNTVYKDNFNMCCSKSKSELCLDKSKMLSKSKILNIMPNLFEKIITKNIQERKMVNSRFDCNTNINISLEKYILRLVKYTSVENSTLVYSLALIDNICSKRLYLSYKNIFKLFLIALIISIKLLEDETYTDEHYAKAGGITVEEFAMLETDFLAIIDYNIVINESKYQIYLNSLL